MDRGNLIAALIAAVLGLSTAALGVAGWIVMPANLEQLRQEKSSLEQQLLMAREMASPTPDAKSYGSEALSRSLSGQASQLLTRIERAGGMDIRYAIGPLSRDEAHISQEIKVGFTGDPIIAGEVFGWLNLQRPGTLINQVTMSADDGGAIEVQLQLTIMGYTDA